MRCLNFQNAGYTIVCTPVYNYILEIYVFLHYIRYYTMRNKNQKFRSFVHSYAILDLLLSFLFVRKIKPFVYHWRAKSLL